MKRMIRRTIGRAIAPLLPRSDRNPWFNFFQRLGLHVTPVHYYQPIPDTRTLHEDLWRRGSTLTGLDVQEQAQLQLLRSFREQYVSEYDAFPLEPTATPHEFYYNNNYFRCVDPEILYCIIRRFRPRRIIEIGSGLTTYLSAQAIRRNREQYGDSCALTAIEPFANETLRAGFPGLDRLRAVAVQEVPLAFFEELGENDVLFIDSSHVLRIGSDVQYEVLEIVPRLKKGVLVHFHDIFFPREYPQEWVLRRHRFWTEQYLVQAFLAFNDSFRIVWAGTFMHLNHPKELAEAFASYRRKLADADWVGPGSLWIQRVK